MKKVWESKTVWVNLIAFVYAIYQGVSGHSAPLDPQVQLAILSAVNWVLRLITKESVSWS